MDGPMDKEFTLFPFILLSYLFFQTEFQIFFSCNHTPDVSPYILWETGKAYSGGLIMSYEKTTKRKCQEEQQKLEIQVSECERAYNQNPTNANLKATLTTRATLNSQGKNYMNLVPNPASI